MTPEQNDLTKKIKENLIKKMDITKRNLSNSKKTIPMVLPLNQVSITNIDAFHFTVPRVLFENAGVRFNFR